jgi:glycolate oxidase FAD binding subunit
MVTERDASDELQQRVRDAVESRTALALEGGGTKAFYGRSPSGEPVRVGGHRGVVSYEPTELVITARAGTPLSEIDQVLSDAGQMLPFEPPHFGADATLGGTLA